MNRKVPVVVVAIIAIVVTIYFTVMRSDVDRDSMAASGTVEATDAALGFQLAGRIERIVPREGDAVVAGQELAFLDRTELEARRAQAQAQLDAARAVLSEMQAGARSEELSQAREFARAASERVADARRDHDRTQRLHQGGAVSQEVLDKVKLALEIAIAQNAQAEDQLKLVQAGPRTERLAAQRAVVAAADAGIRQADAALAYAVIKAPFEGRVTVRDREPGEMVAAGAPVLTLVDLNDRWIRIYIPENRIGAVRLGQAAEIGADTYPSKRYAGEVSFIASTAEFTPRNVQTAEERVKLVYAVKVRITGDPGIDLKPGMPADVSLSSRQD